MRLPFSPHLPKKTLGFEPKKTFVRWILNEVTFSITAVFFNSEKNNKGKNCSTTELIPHEWGIEESNL